MIDGLVDPVIADIQREHADAIRGGGRWRARWVQLAGWWGLLKGASLYALTECATGRTTLVVAAVTAVATLPLVLAPLMNAVPYIHADGISARGPLAIYLLPQAFAISLPVGFAVGVLSQWGDAVPTWRSRQLVLALAVGCSVVTFVNVGWVTPAANQEFRVRAADVGWNAVAVN